MRLTPSRHLRETKSSGYNSRINLACPSHQQLSLSLLQRPAPAPAQVLRRSAQPLKKFSNLIATQHPTPKILAPLSCALTIGALWDTSKYKKVSCSEPLDVTILLPRYQNIADKPESALHRFGAALGSLVKAPSVNRGLFKLTPLITGAAGLQRSTNWIQRSNKKFRGKPHL